MELNSEFLSADLSTVMLVHDFLTHPGLGKQPVVPSSQPPDFASEFFRPLIPKLLEKSENLTYQDFVNEVEASLKFALDVAKSFKTFIPKKNQHSSPASTVEAVGTLHDAELVRQSAVEIYRDSIVSDIRNIEVNDYKDQLIIWAKEAIDAALLFDATWAKLAESSNLEID